MIRWLRGLFDRADARVLAYIEENINSTDPYKRARAEGLAEGRLGKEAYAFFLATARAEEARAKEEGR